MVHHSGKSRVFSHLKSLQNQLAMIDEDPGTVKTTFERNLILEGEMAGIKLYSDNRGNRVLILKGKLEDWIVNLCKKSGVKLDDFGLPEKPNELHSLINQRIDKLERLIDHLQENKNADLLQLKTWLR